MAPMIAERGAGRGNMAAGRDDTKGPKHWESVHVCPQCRFVINLKDLGLKGGATGVVICPQCEWSGPVEIHIVHREAAEQK